MSKARTTILLLLMPIVSIVSIVGELQAQTEQIDPIVVAARYVLGLDNISESGRQLIVDTNRSGYRHGLHGSEMAARTARLAVFLGASAGRIDHVMICPLKSPRLEEYDRRERCRFVDGAAALVQVREPKATPVGLSVSVTTWIPRYLPNRQPFVAATSREVLLSRDKNGEWRATGIGLWQGASW